MKRKDIDPILANILVVLLILISVISLVMLRDFIGYVGWDGARGGYIKSINVVQQFPATYWHGVAGIALEVSALNSSWYIFADNAGISELNPLFTCFENGIEHEIYATTLGFNNISWSNVQVGTTQMIDDFVGMSYNDTMSASNTFTETINVELGGRILSNVPAAYMKRYDEPGSEDFVVGILQYEGEIIMVGIINSGYLSGYRPDKTFNYEMMVPVPPNTSALKYNIFSDPFDECPEGEEGVVIDTGGIYGWVTDNLTNSFLPNTLVAIEHKAMITGTDGYYSFANVQVGSYHLIAIKTGFGNYVKNITIPYNTSVEHNISMNIIFDEELTGTGPGIGTGVGPGDDPPGTKTKSGTGPGVGPGIGPFIEKPEDLGKDFFITLSALNKKIRVDNYFTEEILIFSFRNEDQNIKFKVTGDAAQILELSDSIATIQQNQYANLTVRGFGVEEGVYAGSIDIEGDFNATLPVDIKVVSADKLPVEALLMQLQPLTKRPLPGKNFKFSVNLQNLLIEDSYPVELEYYIRGVDSETRNNSIFVGNDTIELITTETLIKEIIIPNDWTKGDYFLTVEANYLDLFSKTSTIFELEEPVYNYKVLGFIQLWKLLVALLGLAAIIGSIIYIRYRIEAKKRFHVKVEYKLLPKKGAKSLYVGKIAETEEDTYFDMDKLTVHTIVAGSTGGGKTISAQVIVEECLKKNIAVVVFDPTAQWTGMLRKCSDQKMISYYPRFHYTKKDAKAFSGNIRAIKNPREKIDLSKYWKPGEIQVFTVNTLDPKGIDIFVANTVREVFHSNLQEFRGLRMLMVYDEVHRLLPKFGGSGEGFIQIERACREFRKWGIGVLLVSQVLADFVGQIKANINTEVQMKTRDEGDLKRIETKYGASFVQELVKSPVGSGMIQNSSWNRGKPYYVTFRPILHSVVRLEDAELDKYNKYNMIVDDLSYQLDQLEEIGRDVFDLRLELKLALDKIKQGSFNMVDIYLEGLSPRVEAIWKELGKKPKKMTVELISEEDLKASIKEAEKESENVKEDEIVEEEVKALGINDDVAPDKILKLVNGMLVIKLNSLLDEINAMKESEFQQHVNEDKNEFSDWIRDAVGNAAWANIADQIITKEDYVKFLELLSQGKEKEFKPTTLREHEYKPKVEEVPVEEPNKEEPEEKQEETKSEEIPTEETKKEEPNTTAEIPKSETPEPLNWTNIKSKLESLQTPESKLYYLTDLLEKNPTNINLMFSIASQYHRIKDYEKAEKYYNTILQIEPTNTNALYYLGNLFTLQNKNKEALELFNKIIQIKPDYPNIKQKIEKLKNE